MAKSTKEKCRCFYCGKEYVDTNYYKSNSELYVNIGKIPYCKQCVGKLYQYFLEKYAKYAKCGKSAKKNCKIVINNGSSSFL